MLEHYHPNQRLSEDDARQVEIIHTNSFKCGSEKQMGHYDFYLNGGIDQPGCLFNGCSHSRSWTYFAESLYRNSKGFYGKYCKWKSVDRHYCSGEFLIMGGLSKKNGTPGMYYVGTNDREPYARGRM